MKIEIDEENKTVKFFCKEAPKGSEITNIIANNALYLYTIEIVKMCDESKPLPYVSNSYNPNLKGMKVGDKIYLRKGVKPLPSRLTKGRGYEILDVVFSPINYKMICYTIRNDIGRLYKVPVSNHFGRWSRI